MDDRWTDVFITKASDTPADGYDDVFCCSVQSIEIDPDKPTTCYITENQSPWILPTWTKQYSTRSARNSEYANLEVGDLVRIGEVDSHGFTDYLTVVEIRQIEKIANATKTNVGISIRGAWDPTFNQTAGVDYLNAAATNSTGTNNESIEPATHGIAHIAIRLNVSLNATTLPSYTVNQDSITNPYGMLRQARNQLDSTPGAFADLSTRANAYTYQSTVAEAFTDEFVESEKYFYPVPFVQG